ncbi:MULTISPECIES: TIGR03826 family flagellar region protein [Brevibacillus]|uniref:Flagellar protein n=1 Tax=Brevibacillus laterosporus TaxID=1465 RepID=A0AAP3DBK1_BRELA|nr:MULTISPECIES: TIGR03826 family flagellar region protein [Brevibacillus]ATO49129.1 flagellar protein [Brevibacillus laterosporus DSM 25]AYB40791.1 flagellar protein [Brevibacillus laterosporus]MBG9787672.1 flagellar protein [Brevibacillus laterosporus]MBG9800521.1 flagellar protein [Brevibacillus laterosporus]MBG9803623.1 flagellar protein [Brevibacillus laterosporus]
MGLGHLANCPICDVLFVKGIRDVCPSCYKEQEKQYELCVSFLRKRENRGATMYQLSEGTGVDVKEITRFIREGRISVQSNPNLGYPCESCGEIIQSGALCTNCSGKLQREITQQMDVDRRLTDDERKRNQVYKFRKE